MWMLKTLEKKALLSVPYCYEEIAMVASNGRYGYPIVIWYIEINKVVAQFLPVFRDL